ncbi:glycosyltransferase [Xanthomonas citri]|uniref:glycosyltransferase n=1 Tax=Xanthomonas citri TaxID=346 RepID=UPI0001CECBB8|nr:glycosyltransferase [Xanthomonas citri]AMU97288.1 glycosyl transferase family 1 [Xanthomonas citri pv. aurantifolii]AMV01635.1 glycosyl transferase family 1 [Xanthomonas citri pv. aurantifolii]EFF48680.1 bifunctional glycosyltransferase [Xanthomonas citri pv. aurantifolii str. ICPB 10535]TBW98354.1 glycosyl transferase family 1 [Xanthomonas citri pv. aurantifolii]TBW99630.1 glycosyl transferase family 1 [Xanthomonas citri pv. aurantifolii]
MRIAIDLQAAQTASRHRGIGRYSLALAEAMLREPRAHEFWLVINGDMASDAIDSLAALLPRERVVAFRTAQPVHWRDPANAWRRTASEHMRESFLQALQPDIVHVTSVIEGASDGAVTSIGRGMGGARTAATLYDLIPLHDPRYIAAPWAAEWYADKVASLQRADVLLSISDYVRNDAIERLSVAPERVVNISSAASQIFRPIHVDSALRGRFAHEHGIVGKYLMYSGAMDPRKNLEVLVAAYALLGQQKQERYQLVVTGALDELERARLALVARRLKLSPDRIVCTGHVTDQSLVELYCGAELFVLPSLQEGFGLPLLEAMACGTAVIGARASSIPEVIGRDDALFDPTDPAAIAGAMRRVLEDTDFARSLRHHGPQRARAFSWACSASRALDAFEACGQVHPAAKWGWRETSEALQKTRAALVADLAHACGSRVPVADADLLQVAVAMDANEDLVRDVLRRQHPLPQLPSWRVEGPFDSSYSLALVNRELARALDAQGLDVLLHSTDGSGDFDADPEFLASDQQIARLHSRASESAPVAADVCSRLLYPPRIADMDSRFNLLHAYAWEESAVPEAWVADFNEFVQGISALSTHVVKTLVDSGVAIPLGVCGAGVDHWESIAAAEGASLQQRGFSFLHVSSCLPRKGVDVLLQAYGDAFSDRDDVSLIIKTFANPQNEIRRLLHDARRARADFPHVILIEEDVDSASLKRLYSQCDVMVAPSRAEGFGLPLAEAMLSGLAVITTAWGGQCDFCNDQTAWLIDYTFAPAETVFGLPHSVWAEPSRAGLSRLLREVHRLPAEQRNERTRRGRQLLQRHFRWTDVAQRLLAFVRDLWARPIRTATPLIAWIAPSSPAQGSGGVFAELSGLAGELALFEIDASIISSGATMPAGLDFPSESRHCATRSLPVIGHQLTNAVVIDYPDILHYGHWFAGLLEDQLDRGRIVVVLLRRVAASDPWEPALIRAFRRCDRVLVAGVADLNLLKSQGVSANTAILPTLGGNVEIQQSALRLWSIVRALLWQRHADPSIFSPRPAEVVCS